MLNVNACLLEGVSDLTKDGDVEEDNSDEEEEGVSDLMKDGNVEEDDSDNSIDDNEDDDGDNDEEEDGEMEDEKENEHREENVGKEGEEEDKEEKEPKASKRKLLDHDPSLIAANAKKDARLALAQHGLLKKGSDSKLSGFKIPSSEQLSVKRVDPSKLEVNIRRKLRKEERLALVKAGREDREKYQARTAVKQKNVHML